ATAFKNRSRPSGLNGLAAFITASSSESVRLIGCDMVGPRLLRYDDSRPSGQKLLARTAPRYSSGGAFFFRQLMRALSGLGFSKRCSVQSRLRAMFSEPRPVGSALRV